MEICMRMALNGLKKASQLFSNYLSDMVGCLMLGFAVMVFLLVTGTAFYHVLINWISGQPLHVVTTSRLIFDRRGRHCDEILRFSHCSWLHCPGVPKMFWGR